MEKYWEQETPKTINTSKNALQFFEYAGKLSVARPAWKDGAGKEQRGKTVVLDIAAILESDENTIKEMRDVFTKINKRLDEHLND